LYFLDNLREEKFWTLKASKYRRLQ
jgi:hypothetical protein